MPRATAYKIGFKGNRYISKGNNSDMGIFPPFLFGDSFKGNNFREGTDFSKSLVFFFSPSP